VIESYKQLHSFSIVAIGRRWLEGKSRTHYAFRVETVLDNFIQIL
jgi:hypothetical protein